MKKYLEYLGSFLKEEVNKADCKGIVFGISGGVDSAVIAGLAHQYFPKNHLAVFMPCNSQALDYECVGKLIIQFNLNAKTIDLANEYNMVTKQIENNYEQPLNTLAKINIKPRLRMTVLYSLAQNEKYLVIGTGNLIEWYLGYFTKYGDGAADLYPLIHLTKSQVFSAAKILNVPQIIIDRPPTASLFEGQTDEKEMGVTYKEVEDYLANKIISDTSKNIIENLHKKTTHKRKNLIIPKPF